MAIVTGAGSGIGRATALHLSAMRASVIVADIDTAGGEETVKKIIAADGIARLVHMDVSRSHDVEDLIATTLDTYGRLDYAVNNAGIGSGSTLTADCSEDEWNRTISINLTGVWLCMKHEIPAMLNGGGSIVNVSSVYGLVGRRTGVAYAASKHGINGLTKTAALEYASQGIRVNAVCPGGILTAMTERLNERDPNYFAELLKAEPVGRLGSAQEVANAIVWLCSDSSSFLTGAIVPIDGGWTAQ